MEVVVIPDTQIMYTKSDNANVFDLYEVDSLRVEGASNPFGGGNSWAKRGSSEISKRV